MQYLIWWVAVITEQFCISFTQSTIRKASNPSSVKTTIIFFVENVLIVRQNRAVLHVNIWVCMLIHKQEGNFIFWRQMKNLLQVHKCFVNKKFTKETFVNMKYFISSRFRAHYCVSIPSMEYLGENKSDFSNQLSNNVKNKISHKHLHTFTSKMSYNVSPHTISLKQWIFPLRRRIWYEVQKSNIN